MNTVISSLILTLLNKQQLQPVKCLVMHLLIKHVQVEWAPLIPLIHSIQLQWIILTIRNINADSVWELSEQWRLCWNSNSKQFAGYHIPTKKNSIPLHSRNLYHTRQQLFSVIRGTHFSHCYTGICWEQITPSILVSSLLLNNEQPLLCWINRKSFTEINTGRSNNWKKNIFWWKYFTFNLISIQIYNRWWSMPAIFGMPSISGDWWDSNWCL